ncbi:MAG: DMT family transporter [Desulfovibrio sp.]|jgi:uncharacterized membrane protein|nr:DMT family transporter [Desulfovibrio sp.]
MGWGELTALMTAVVWAISSQINGSIGRRVGAVSVSLLRMPFQTLFLALACGVAGGGASFGPQPVVFIFLSGLTGVTLGDLLLYKAIVILGTRAGILLQSLSTSCTALFGLLFLGEPLTLQLATGIFLATMGVGIAVTAGLERSTPPGQPPLTRREIRRGICFGLAGAAFLALSFITLRAGMQGDMDPYWGAFLRALLGGGLLWLAGLPGHWSQAAVRSCRASPFIALLLCLSCLLGALGMWGACESMRLIPAGIAATIMGLQPVWVIVTASLWERSLPSLRIVLGAGVAFGGTALVCLR